MAERRAARANTLIDALPQPQRDRLLRGFEPVEMRPGEILCEVDKPFGHAYFPRRGSISLVAKQGGHNAMAVGLIGCEGMLGESVVLGIDLAPIHALVQGPGDAWRIPVSRLRDALDDGATLGTILGQYLHVRIRELSLAGTCTRFHPLERRLARWLLVTDDRLQADHFHLTHERLADLLGVRRSGVTVAAGALQARHLIGYARGDIKILDRAGLEDAACDCYAMLKAG